MDEDPIDSAVRRLRPEPGWAGSTIGRQRLQQVIQGVEPTRRPTRRMALLLAGPRQWRRPMPAMAGLACLTVIAVALAENRPRLDENENENENE